MIEDLRGLAVFVAIAEAGSLTAAGKRLKLSTSVVSHLLSRLEDKLGVFADWPDSGPQKALTRRLIDFLVEGRPGADASRLSDRSN